MNLSTSVFLYLPGTSVKLSFSRSFVSHFTRHGARPPVESVYGCSLYRVHAKLVLKPPRRDQRGYHSQQGLVLEDTKPKVKVTCPWNGKILYCLIFDAVYLNRHLCDPAFDATWPVRVSCSWFVGSMYEVGWRVNE